MPVPVLPVFPMCPCVLVCPYTTSFQVHLEPVAPLNVPYKPWLFIVPHWSHQCRSLPAARVPPHTVIYPTVSPAVSLPVPVGRVRAWQGTRGDTGGAVLPAVRTAALKGAPRRARPQRHRRGHRRQSGTGSAAPSRTLPPLPASPRPGAGVPGRVGHASSREGIAGHRRTKHSP